MYILYGKLISMEVTEVTEVQEVLFGIPRNAGVQSLIRREQMQEIIACHTFWEWNNIR